MSRLPRFGKTTSHGLSRLHVLLLVVLIWTTVGFFSGLVDILSGGSWPNLVNKVCEAWVWALLTPAILFANRYLSSYKLPWRVSLLLLLSIPFSLAHTYITAVILLPIKEITWNPLRDPVYVTYYFLGGWMTYGAIVATLTTLEYYQRFLTGQLELERIEKKLLQSHLNALRLQLEPHFLFNTLNAISSEVASNPELAREMIEDLGALLRLSLDFKDSTEITLDQEVVLLKHYLSIQKVRFGDSLQVRLSIEPAITSALVPCMLLQPIVENAIRHGVGRRMSGGTVTISALRVNGNVEIRVEDDGVGLPPGWAMETGKGLGVTATQERLSGLYPDVFQPFEIRRRNGDGTEVVMRVPLRTSNGETP